MYRMNADDFHHPSVWMSELLSPLLAAVVAAPIQKL